MDSENFLIIKCYPELSQLLSGKLNVTCTEEGCDRIFTSEANMRQHLRKFHKKVNDRNQVEFIVRQYHCPVKECTYNEKNSFATLKYLKQHYVKVHAEKKFSCDKCQKQFSTNYLKTVHEQSCGKMYKCLDCDNQYPCYETLLTHGRRKKHNIDNKEILHPWRTKKKHVSENNNDIVRFKMITQTKLIPVAAAPIAQDKGVQTDAQLTEIKPKTKRRATRETQTCSRKKTRKSAETQTSAAANKPAPAPPHPPQDINQICLQTPTGDFIAETDYFEEKEEISNPLKIQGVDPNLGGLDFIHSSVQSNNTNMFDCSPFNNCNTETQTDFMFENDLLSAETQTNHLTDLDLYTNMYTQTYDDLLLPEAYENFMTQSVLNLDINDREMSNTHTQTEMEYLQLLEEINA